MPTPPTLRLLLEQELSTDRIFDDVTTRLLGRASEKPAEALVIAKESGVFSGRQFLQVVSDYFKASAEIEPIQAEGEAFSPGRTLLKVRGTVGLCLTLERTLLNLLSHLSGVATLTSRYVQAVRPHRAKILATRKTLPGLREVELEAVRAGGGFVHRRSLSDGILIKDNHLAFLGEAEILKTAKTMRSPLHRVEIEVQSLEALDRVLISPPEIIMLDNFDLEQMAIAMKKIAGRAEVEVSGGVTLDAIPAISALGVDYISVGKLTHSAPSIDLTMDIFAK